MSVKGEQESSSVASTLGPVSLLDTLTMEKGDHGSLQLLHWAWRTRVNLERGLWAPETGPEWPHISLGKCRRLHSLTTGLT